MNTLDVDPNIILVLADTDNVESRIMAMVNGQSQSKICDVVDNLSKHYKNLGVAVSMLKDKVAVLNQQQQAIVSVQDRIKSLCLKIMVEHKIDKVKTLESQTLVCVGPSSCNISDESKLPSEFIEMVPKVDKSKIKKLLESGQDVAGASLSAGVPYIKIS